MPEYNERPSQEAETEYLLTCPEAGAVQRLGQLLQLLLPLEEDEVPLILLYEVHLMNQTKNFGLNLGTLEEWSGLTEK